MKIKSLYCIRRIILLLLIPGCSISTVFAQQDTCNRTVRLSPGDALQVQVFPDTALFANGVYPIDDRGCASLPILGYVKVSETPVTEIEQRLRTAYLDYLPHPNIHVTPLYRISLLGGFYNPGLYYISPRRSLWDAVRIAGGTQREDGIKKIVWERDRKVISDDIVSEYESGASLVNIGFESGDQLRVTSHPKHRFWQILNERIIPVLSVTATLLTSSLTVYITMQTLDQQ